jgi:hypothetical protein
MRNYDWKRSCLVAALVLGAGSARAQTTTSSTAAEALFDAGRAALEKHDYATACEKFDASNKIGPGVGSLLNLGFCNEMLGKIATAWTSYREALYKLPAGDPRAVTAHHALDQLQQQLPYLTIKVAAGSWPGMTLLLDGVEFSAGTVGVAVPVDPGDHQVIVRAPGRALGTFHKAVRVGEKAELTVSPGVEEAPKPVVAAAPAVSAPPKPAVQPQKPEPPPENKSEGGSPAAGYIIGGVGVAALATSVVTGIMALGKNSTVKDHCDAAPAGSLRLCDPTGLQAADSGKTLALVSDITLGVGLVGVGVGTYLVVTAGSGASRERASIAFHGAF